VGGGERETEAVGAARLALGALPVALGGGEVETQPDAGGVSGALPLAPAAGEPLAVALPVAAPLGVTAPPLVVGADDAETTDAVALALPEAVPESGALAEPEGLPFALAEAAPEELDSPEGLPEALAAAVLEALLVD
jgi:hypothetical protein